MCFFEIIRHVVTFCRKCIKMRNNQIKLCVLFPQVSGSSGFDGQSIIGPLRAITSSPSGGSASSSPAAACGIMSAVQSRALSIESCTEKDANLPPMMMMSHHDMMQSSSSPYVLNGDVDENCKSRNGSSRNSSNGSGGGGYDDPTLPVVNRDMSPGGFSLSNKSFCSGLDGDSPPSPMRFHNGGIGINNNGHHHAHFQWMKQNCHGMILLLKLKKTSFV